MLLYGDMFQIIVFLLLKYLLASLFLKEKIFPREDHLFQIKYIFVSNHISRLDGFVTMASLKYATFQILYPFAFMAHPNYLNRWWKRLLLYPLGMYPAKPVPNPKIKYGLEKSEELINKGYSMMIFPEGTRTLPGKTRPKKGIVVLATHNKLPILPIHIDWKRVGKGKRKKATLVFGSPFCLLENRDFDDLAKFIMDYIYSL